MTTPSDSLTVTRLVIDQSILFSNGDGREMHMRRKTRNSSYPDKLILNLNWGFLPVIFYRVVCSPKPCNRNLQKRRLFVTFHPTFDHQCRLKLFRATACEGPVRRKLRTGLLLLLRRKTDVHSRDLPCRNKPNPAYDHGPAVPIPYLQNNCSSMFSVLNGIASWLCIPQLKICLFLGRFCLLEKAPDSDRSRTSSHVSTESRNPFTYAVLVGRSAKSVPAKQHATEKYEHYTKRDKPAPNIPFLPPIHPQPPDRHFADTLVSEAPLKQVMSSSPIVNWMPPPQKTQVALNADGKP